MSNRALGFSRFNPGRAARALWRPTSIPAAIALVVVVLSGIFAEWQNNRVFEQEQRARVLSELSLVRAKLEGNINGNIQLVRGLVATLSTEPDMDQARFAELAEKIFQERSQLRNIAAAPNFVIRLMYPLKGNEKALGLDYLKNEQQRETALRARKLGELVLAGPVNLVQGGQGFIARMPVYAKRNGVTLFWGIVSAVVNVDELYSDSGLKDPKLGIDVALTGKDATGEGGALFFGSEAVVNGSPVMADVVLPAGSWQIAAVPKGGWHAMPDNLWTLRLIILAAGALVVVPMLVAGQLIEERHRHMGQLQLREAELQQLSRRLGLALEASKLGVWELDLQTDLACWDARMCEMLGVPFDARPRDASHWRAVMHPDDYGRVEAELRHAISTGARFESQFRVILPGGTIRHLRSAGTLYAGPDGARKFIGVDWDVTADVALNEDFRRAKLLTEARNLELEAAKARIEHDSLHDALTGLANRRYLDEVLRLHAERCRKDGGGVALLHMDLDRFKQINDTLGHAAGDAMLMHVAKVLKASTRAEDFVARIGGDEFVIFCADAGEPDYLARLAGRIIEELRQPVAYEGHQCRFGVSVGIAGTGGADFDPKQLLVDADIALYRAKSRGRNRYEFFTPALQAEIVSTKRIADEILGGLEQHQFVPWYQPQFDAETHAVVGVEALARWQHPTRGLLSPEAFLRIAEELNVVATIDRMILEQALVHSLAWTAAGVSVPKISVNVSARRLHDEELVASLRGLRIRPGTVAFELVESVFLDEGDPQFARNVEQIKELGIDIEIDDFGTGYASIVSLMKLKPRRLKIDRQLVMPLTRSPAQRNLVRSIIEIGRSLGIDAIAEGVETMEHALILRDLGCRALQGYAFARAMSAADLTAFMQAAQERRRAS